MSSFAEYRPTVGETSLTSGSFQVLSCLFSPTIGRYSAKLLGVFKSFHVFFRRVSSDSRRNFFDFWEFSSLIVSFFDDYRPILGETSWSFQVFSCLLSPSIVRQSAKLL